MRAVSRHMTDYDSVEEFDAVAEYGDGPVSIGGVLCRVINNVLRADMHSVPIDVFGPCGYGYDDSGVFQKAVSAIETPVNRFFKHEISLRPGATYKLATHVKSSGQHFGLRMNGATITRHASNPVAPIYSSAVTPDTTIPDANNPGPMLGCAFYFTSLIYYPVISNGTFNGFRVPLCYLSPHNTPIYDRVTIEYCNAGILNYRGTQNPYFIRPITRGNPMGPLIIGAATCYPNGSAYAGADNYYFDGMRAMGGGGSIEGGIINAHFDNWFRDSVLRPSIGSYTVANSNYVFPFADGAPECSPSGWALAYAPFRNPRTMYSFYAENMDYRTGVQRGIALLNTDVSELHIDKFWGEQFLTSATEYFRVGSLRSGSVCGYNTKISGQPQLPFFGFTGQGVSNGGIASPINITFIDYVPMDTDTNFYPGISQGLVYGRGFINRSQFNTYTGNDGRNDAPTGASLDLGTNASKNSVGDIIKGWNCAFYLPVKRFNTALGADEWKRCISVANDGTNAFGIVSISTTNGQTGATDVCEYELQMGASTLTVGNGVTINNGDMSIPYTGSDPANFSRRSQYQIGATGVYVSVDYVDKTNNILYLLMPVCGLATPYVGDGSTTTLTKSQYCRMKTGWVKKGTLTTTTTSAAVTGNGTKFLRDVKEDQHLYDRETGKYIGKVLSIASDTALTLTANTNLVVTAQTFCARETDWWLFALGVAPSFNTATTLYLVNRLASSNGSGSPTTSLTTTSVSLHFDCSFKSI